MQILLPRHVSSDCLHVLACSRWPWLPLRCYRGSVFARVLARATALAPLGMQIVVGDYQWAVARQPGVPSRALNTRITCSSEASLRWVGVVGLRNNFSQTVFALQSSLDSHAAFLIVHC